MKLLKKMLAGVNWTLLILLGSILFLGIYSFSALLVFAGIELMIDFITEMFSFIFSWISYDHYWVFFLPNIIFLIVWLGHSIYFNKDK